ncbi:hypothetical protein SKAU_G00416680 [Synaphobranchus kaupii]|uniref:UPAR/Ly6 domain-containing protein n=1 Tax=Synaphobranchus kaupii TaxID=118154 RepID=A0A9Q1E5T1_SYNKA|nr:hypothetical protein SKAU_G00416680 [Synaphobranchus kaupii]
MKLLVTLALACALFSKVYPLDCYECNTTGPGPCSQTTKTCPPSQTRCSSGTVVLSAGINQSEFRQQSCAAPAECVSGSVNIRNTRISVNNQCCDSNLCNDQQIPALPGTSPNGKTCFTCVDFNCPSMSTLECIGPEDQCIKLSVTVGQIKGTAKGCASKTFCSGSLNSQILPFDMVDLSCCEGDMCNNALRIGQSILFLLLVPLASFILFN